MKKNEKAVSPAPGIENALAQFLVGLERQGLIRINRNRLKT
ncbi:MAG: hypothetical protein ABSC50_09635 [Candidatus Bathyarchaeia archaeon]